VSLFSHQPVLLTEVVTSLQPKAHGRYLDGTLGGGGHASAILEASSPDGFLYGCDRDAEALAAAHDRLKPYGDRFKTRQCSARSLGLDTLGHLGVGARGDVTVYTDHPDRERMFQRPRYVFKAGEMIVRDGELVASPTGATHVVKPAYDRAIEKHIADYYQRFMTVRPNNLRVAAGEIEDDGRGRLVVHHTGRRV